MRYENIQLLRFVAAVGVVLFHLGWHAEHTLRVDRAALRPLRPLALAEFPVPLFFAVSGFVLTQALHAAPGAGRAARAGRFVFARFLRLYPGYWLALLAVVVLMRLRAFTEFEYWLPHLVNATQLTLWPGGPGKCFYFLSGVEWSLIYEVFLSVALAALSLLGLRRGVPVAVCVWLGVLVWKIAARPGYATSMQPHWSTIGLSAFGAPFLMGVLVYYAKDYGRGWRWAVLAAVVALFGFAPRAFSAFEPRWCLWGLTAAGVVWLAVQFRQVSPRDPVARLGNCSYGLFLFHSPLILAVFHAAVRAGYAGRPEVVWAAGAAAVAGGLLFGRVEAGLYAKLRPLGKATLPRLRLRERLGLRLAAPTRAS